MGIGERGGEGEGERGGGGGGGEGGGETEDGRREIGDSLRGRDKRREIGERDDKREKLGREKQRSLACDPRQHSC